MDAEQPASGAEALRRLLEGDTCAAARGLLECVLERRLPDGALLRARITETEAYTPDDPASHSFTGARPRNAAMFGPSATAYVYRSYGVHWCLNVVTGPPGYGAAVLLRAAEPLEGDGRMRLLRGLAADAPAKLIATGPGRLAQALAVDRSFDGAQLLEDSAALRLLPGGLAPGEVVLAGPRIGITKAADWPRRFRVGGG
ncbi:MAG: DNA-3-methyladenine glycosylase [Candidatus Sumerlaeia bacterium]|nr:DNA-3-methyladenine glycosylase [Candidatus Sumerlaeia bacterium]